MVFSIMTTILFFLLNLNSFNEESNTNLNSFTDKTYYLLNVSAGFGKRVVELEEPFEDENLVIDEFQDTNTLQFNLVRNLQRFSQSI